jgi:hypothetical protein
MKKVFLRIVAVGLVSCLLIPDWVAQAWPMSSIPIPSIPAAPLFSRQALNPICAQFPGDPNRRATSRIWELEKLQRPVRFLNLPARVILSLAVIAGPLHGHSQNLPYEPPDLNALWSSPSQHELDRFYGSLRDIEHRLPNETVIQQLRAWAAHQNEIVYPGRTARIRVSAARDSRKAAFIYIESPRLRDPLLEIVIDHASLRINIKAYGRDVAEAQARLLCLFDALGEIKNNARDPRLRAVARRIRAEIAWLVPNSPKNRAAMEEFLRKQAALQALPAVRGHLEMIPDNPDAVEVLQGEYSILQGQGWLKTIGANPCVILSLYDPDTKTALLAHIDVSKDVPRVFDQLLAHLDRLHVHRGSLVAGVLTGTGGRETLFKVYEALSKENIPIGNQDVLYRPDESIELEVNTGKASSIRKFFSAIPEEEVAKQMGDTLKAPLMHCRTAPTIEQTKEKLPPRRISRTAFLERLLNSYDFKESHTAKRNSPMYSPPISASMSHRIATRWRRWVGGSVVALLLVTQSPGLRALQESHPHVTGAPGPSFMIWVAISLIMISVCPTLSAWALLLFPRGVMDLKDRITRTVFRHITFKSSKPPKIKPELSWTWADMVPYGQMISVLKILTFMAAILAIKLVGAPIPAEVVGALSKLVLVGPIAVNWILGISALSKKIDGLEIFYIQGIRKVDEWNQTYNTLQHERHPEAKLFYQLPFGIEPFEKPVRDAVLSFEKAVHRHNAQELEASVETMEGLAENLPRYGHTVPPFGLFLKPVLDELNLWLEEEPALSKVYAAKIQQLVKPPRSSNSSSTTHRQRDEQPFLDEAVPPTAEHMSQMGAQRAMLPVPDNKRFMSIVPGDPSDPENTEEIKRLQEILKKAIAGQQKWGEPVAGQPSASSSEHEMSTVWAKVAGYGMLYLTNASNIAPDIRYVAHEVAHEVAHKTDSIGPVIVMIAYLSELSDDGPNPEPWKQVYAEMAGVSIKQAGHTLIQAGLELKGLEEAKQLQTIWDTVADFKTLDRNHPSRIDSDIRRVANQTEAPIVVMAYLSELPHNHVKNQLWATYYAEYPGVTVEFEEAILVLQRAQSALEALQNTNPPARQLFRTPLSPKLAAAEASTIYPYIPQVIAEMDLPDEARKVVVAYLTALIEKWNIDHGQFAELLAESAGVVVGKAKKTLAEAIWYLELFHKDAAEQAKTSHHVVAYDGLPLRSS